MNKTYLCLICFVALLAGCGSSDKKAAELLDTARFEEKQHNTDHASKLYDEILKKYPESASAKEASARLNALKARKP